MAEVELPTLGNHARLLEVNGDLTPVLVTFIILDFLIAMIRFWVAYRLIIAGKDYLTHVQWFIGYLAFFFILTNG
uniref:Uncharacterized protein n=1 Tax=Archaeoglobus fulgidus TaxID=2234 RepID=A0A7J3M0Z9_ARCFL